MLSRIGVSDKLSCDEMVERIAKAFIAISVSLDVRDNKHYADCCEQTNSLQKKLIAYHHVTLGELRRYSRAMVDLFTTEGLTIKGEEEYYVVFEILDLSTESLVNLDRQSLFEQHPTEVTRFNRILAVAQMHHELRTLRLYHVRELIDAVRHLALWLQ